MKVDLKYGKQGLTVEFPEHATVIEPEFIAGLADEKAAFLEALRQPIGSKPLKDLIKPEDTIAIVFSDLTRPVPNTRIIPWLLEELAFHPKERITLINATGMHRMNTEEELISMLTKDVVQQYRVVNHVSTEKETLTSLGTNSFGGPVYVNSEYYRADVKILTGFIEPHFFAGFSGGPKAVLPGVAGAETVMHNHGAQMIGNPKATWGITRGNPLWEEIHEVAAMTHPTFLINVTLNKDRAITGIFAGDLDQAHAQGVEFVRKTAMQPVEQAFDIVVTTNSGYPLDINLYQTVKGMSAARKIVKKGGSIIAVSECWDGIPEHGNYKKILHEATSLQNILDTIHAPGYSQFDQWEAQIQAMIQLWADVYLYSSLSEDEVKKTHITPIPSIEACVAELQHKYGPNASIAVLPEGPQTIPYLFEK
ncbi:MAG: nickel-dependent lactate racemase [Candidatus Vecturithrix sp.]|jgi:nickel-dependent lactate racemase|nr:nickel-dependent lactate racemase [Candidatus Vecturithrix sp.]